MSAAFISASLILPIHHGDRAEARRSSKVAIFHRGRRFCRMRTRFSNSAHHDSDPKRGRSRCWNVSESQATDALRFHGFVSISRRGEITRALRAGKPGPHYCRRKRYFYWRQKRVARHRSFHVRCFIGPVGTRRSFFSLASLRQR